MTFSDCPFLPNIARKPDTSLSILWRFSFKLAQTSFLTQRCRLDYVGQRSRWALQVHVGHVCERKTNSEPATLGLDRWKGHSDLKSCEFTHYLKNWRLTYCEVTLQWDFWSVIKKKKGISASPNMAFFLNVQSTSLWYAPTTYITTAKGLIQDSFDSLHCPFQSNPSITYEKTCS